jgi:hypothetical protein
MQKQLSKLNDHSPAHAKLKDATASFYVTRNIVRSNEVDEKSCNIFIAFSVELRPLM